MALQINPAYKSITSMLTKPETVVTDTNNQPANILSKPVTSNTVSAADLSTPVAPVTVPTPIQAPIPDTSTAQAVATSTQEELRKLSEAETKRNDLMNQYAGLAGGDTLQGMFQQGLDKAMVPETQKRLQDVMLQLNKLQTDSNLTKVGIAGAGGQTLEQGQRELTQEDREAAVRSAGLASEASILQGNIETATSLVSQSVQYAYQDKLVQNQNLMNQIDQLQGVVDQETSERLTQEQRAYEQENFKITQAISSVNSAVASGFASAEDVATMTSLSGDPVAQKEYADKILAKASRTQYLDALAATRAAANAAAAQAATDEQGAAAAKVVTAQTALDVIDVIKNNPLGIKAIAGSTGFGQTSLSTAFESVTKGFVGGTAAGAAAGAPFAGVGAVPGGALGGVLGAIGGGLTGTYQASKQRSDVAAGLGFLVNSETFAEMRRLKERGVTFGSLTEGERVAIGKSADALFSAMEVDESGAVTGVNVSEERFQTLLNDFQAKQKQYLAQAQLQASGLSAEDYQFITGQ